MAEDKITVKQIKKILDKNFEDYLNINKNTFFTLAEDNQRINTIQQLLLKNRKRFQQVRKKAEIPKSYGKNIGVEITHLDYMINRNRINFLETVKNIYEDLNKIANLINNEQKERDYAIYYYDSENQQYYRKRIDAKNFKNYIGFKDSNKDKITGTNLSQIKNDMKAWINKSEKNFEIQQNFSNHVNDFLNIIKSEFGDFGQSDIGFAYEVFEYHMQKYDHFEIDTKTGSLKSFTPHTWQYNERNKNSIIENYRIAKKGQAKWLTGGDVFETQVKSIKNGSNFDISSLSQIEISFNNLYDIFFNKNEVKTELSSNDIKRLILFLNDFHEDISVEFGKTLEDRIKERTIETIKGLGLNIIMDKT